MIARTHFLIMLAPIVLTAVTIRRGQILPRLNHHLPAWVQQDQINTWDLAGKISDKVEWRFSEKKDES